MTSVNLGRRVADVQFMLTGNLQQDMVSRLLTETTQRVGQGARSLLVAISCPGGSVYWAVTAYNFLRGLGVEVITHNMGQVDSSAGVIYMAGDRRLCVGQGRFLVHGLTWTFGGVDPMLSEKQLRDTLMELEQSRDNVATILSERSGTPLEVVQDTMIQSSILTATEAITYGFVHEVKDDVFEPAQEIVNIVGV